MKRKAFLTQPAEWLIAALVIVFVVLLYNNRISERQTIRIEYNQRDAEQIQAQRTLLALLQTPITVNGHSLTIAELFTYRELDEQYDPILVNALAKYAPDYEIILKSGANTVAQYGRRSLKNHQTTQSQIPSLSGKPLFILLTTNG